MDRFTRQRTGNVKTDLACKGRERQNNPKAQEIKTKFENCQVCGKSYKKSRGLSIHMSLTSCRSILERTNRNSKSISSSPPESHHSGSTKGINLPRHSSTPAQAESMKESEKLEVSSQQKKTSVQITAKEKIREEDILVIDNEIEKSIKKTVLTLPQCIEKKLKGIRNGSEGRIKHREEKFVILQNSSGHSKKETLSKREKKKYTKAEPAGYMNIKKFVDYNTGSTQKQGQEKRIKSVVIKKEVATKQGDVRRVVAQQKLTKTVRWTDKSMIDDSPRTVEWVDSSNLREVATGNQSHKINEREVIETSGEKAAIDTGKVIEISDEEITDAREVIEVSDDEVATSTDKREIIDVSNEEASICPLGDERQVTATKGSAEDFKRVTVNLNSGNPDDLISKNFLELKRRDYRSLTGRNELNDKVIDEYLHLIQERSKKPGLPTVYAMTTHAYTWLDLDFSKNFDKVESWIPDDITTNDIILIPIHKINHWSLVVFNTKKSLLTYHDSVIGTRRTSNANKVMKRFFSKLCEKKGKALKIQTRIDERAPLQRNGYDCGVFVCENAELISRGILRKPKQEGMSNVRKRIMKEIYLGNLNTERNPSIFEMVKKTERTEKSRSSPERAQRKVIQKKAKEKVKPVKEASKVGSTISAKERINWPMSNSPEWARLDKDLAALLRILYAPAQNRAKTHPNIIYSMCKERFGIVESRQKKDVKAGPSSRQRRCKRLREEIATLKKAYTEAPPEERGGIQEIQREKLKQLRLAKRAESLRQNRKKFSSNCKAFLTQPYQFARDIWSPKPRGDMGSSKEEVENFLRNAHADSNRQSMEKNDKLLEYPETEEDFDDKAPPYIEFMKKLIKTRSKSAPGPNGVPYLLYKRCPSVAKLLWGYLRELWNKNALSDAWREAEGVFIPKEDGAKSVEKFRTISLLNVEGKLFFSMKADRITDFLLKNKYINSSIQKGGIPKVSGCIEHTAILSQLIKEARNKKKNLVVTWLDIANAYGSIPHNVISAALEAAHVPEKTRDLIASYYSDVKIRFTTKHFTTEWQRLEKGIITGCTLSVILFSLTMCWLVESVRDVTKGPCTTSGQRQGNSRLFMDDITTTTETVPQTKDLLQKLNEKFQWAGLRVRADKCRSLVIVKGKVQKRELRINEELITSIQDKPIKYLGKEYKANLNEKQQIQEV